MVHVASILWVSATVRVVLLAAGPSPLHHHTTNNSQAFKHTSVSHASTCATYPSRPPTPVDPVLLHSLYQPQSSVLHLASLLTELEIVCKPLNVQARIYTIDRQRSSTLLTDSQGSTPQGFTSSTEEQGSPPSIDRQGSMPQGSSSLTVNDLH